MRQVIVSNIMSLDGYYEGPGRNVMVLNMDEAFDSYNLERIRAAGTVLLGRTSFEGFSSYWPGIADAPDDPGNRALSADNRELSRIYNTSQVGRERHLYGARRQPLAPGDQRDCTGRCGEVAIDGDRARKWGHPHLR
jgi:hypothetical protein